MFKKSLRLLALAPLLVLLSCSSGDSDIFPEVLELRQNQALAQALTEEIIVGENRFTFFVLNEEGVPVVDAKANITFYDLNGGKEVKKAEMDAISVVPARDAGLTEQIIHTHADNSRHVHVNAGEQIGLYSVNTNFDVAGLWGAQVEVKGGTPALHKKLILQFDVIARGTVPNIGDPAPLSRNLTVADVTDLAIIDTSSQPSAEMHTMTIADAVASGKPTLVLFAAPGYCSSFICGPEYEIMRKLYKQYEGKPVNFIHVEFYTDPAGRKTPVQTAVEWKLRTEPWFFLIDRRGLIAARFEGPTSLFELEEALKKVTSN